MQIPQGLLDTLKTLPVIDTHEHIPPENQFTQISHDIIDMLVPYVCDNLIAAGLPRSKWNFVQDKKIPIEERWDVIEPWLPFIRHTTYFQAVMRTLSDIFREPRLDKESARRMTARLVGRNRKEIYREIFSDLHIEKVMTFLDYDQVSSCKDSQLLPVPTVSQILPRNARMLAKLEGETKFSITSLRDLEHAVGSLFEMYSKAGVRAVKFGSAYQRRLDFGAPDRREAERVFEQISRTITPGDIEILGGIEPMLRIEELIPLDDYLTHLMSELAAGFDMPVIFHTGIHAWNINRPERCRASDLTDLISTHPRTRFILLHSGIPFIDEAVLLAAYYPKVTINMAWMHIIDRRKTVEAVHRYLEMLPLNKIIAFGGDYMFVENIYGHLQIALENLAIALGEEIESGRLSEKECVEIARLWLYGNPKHLFNLD